MAVSLGRNSRYNKYLYWIAASLLLFSMGAWHLHLHEGQLQQSSKWLLRLADQDNASIVTGTIVAPPLPMGPHDSKLIVDSYVWNRPTGDIPISGRFSLVVKDVEYDYFKVGDVIRFRARFREIRNFKTPGAFDAEGWWALRGIRVRGYVGRSLDITRVEGAVAHGVGQVLRYHLEGLRSALMRRIDRNVHHKDPKALALALLTGEKAWLSPGLRDAFAATGLGHLLAVSGLHMALVALFTGGLLRLALGRWEWALLHLPVRKAAVGAGMAGAVLYAALAGFSPSAVRAMIMILLFGLAYICGRPQDGINTLALAAWVITLINPFYLFSTSFQLSFTAVFFLILFHKCYQIADTSTPGGIAQGFTTILMVTIVASLATAPLVAFYFDRLSLVGVPLNLLVVPLAGVLILPGLIISVLLLPLPTMDGWMWRLMEFVLSWLARGVEFVSSWNHAFIWVPRPHVWQIVLLYATLLLLIMALYKRSPLVPAIVASFLLASTAVGSMIEHGSPTLRLHVLDVGQGTCQVIELPGGRLMVVDGGGLRGGTLDIGQAVVAPFISTLGYNHIDIMAVSHPEEDHVGGLVSLFDRFSVGEVWTGTQMNKNSLSWHRFLRQVSRYRVRRRIFSGSKEIKVAEGVLIHVLTGKSCPRATGRNNRSLVLCLEFAGRRILLTGDIGRVRELCIDRTISKRVDILVVPHHGSKTSSTMGFVSTLRPLVAIIPVGWKNSLGLPDSSVIRRYLLVGSRIFRTDLDGTVSVVIKDRYRGDHGNKNGKIVIKTFMSDVDAGNVPVESEGDSRRTLRFLSPVCQSLGSSSPLGRI